MWLVFFILSIVGILGLMYYLLVELNEIDKKVAGLVDEIRKHYES